MPSGAKLSAQLKPIIARHHDIEHDNIESVGFQEVAHLPTISGSRHAHSIFG
ncbi:hypothetical protein RLEG12_07975 (plasmid) [Rhizobium leguminosarum bv. trifolii CB782]|nr:hypothetical protein RLEG12_07975 [Rhizobium leguminosarum bv. trifolii CB782]